MEVSSPIPSWALRIWPELTALALAAAVGGTSRLPWMLALALMIRVAWCLAELVHGAGHMVLRAVVDGNTGVLRLTNVLEHRSAAQFMGSLLPLAPIGPPDGHHLPIPWTGVGEQEPWKVRLKACGGLLLNAAAAVLAGWLLLRLPPQSPVPILVLVAGVVVANAALLLASRSDWEAIASGHAVRLHCGNFGFISAPEPPHNGELLSPRAIERFDRMGRETELRGAQAGGGLVMAQDRHGQNCFVGHRIVNAKRGDLTPSLEAGFRRQRQRARRAGIRPHPSSLMASWHYRFGTSGPPAVKETHWLEWSPVRRRRVWQRQNGRWQAEAKTIHHRITHNGDFEAFNFDDSEVDVTALGLWLGQALAQPATAVVDSARIAGMMDLLICQGDWFAAVRWAFLRTLAVYPQTPPPAALEAWTRQLESCFVDHITDQEEEKDNPDGEWMQRLMDRMLPSLSPDPLLRTHGKEGLQHFISNAINAFLYNDPGRAVRQFMDRARGSFGLMVVSTTWADQLVLSSLGQPISIGFDPVSELALYASESTAVDAVLTAADCAWRIDLDQNAGEIAVLSSSDLEITSLSLERELSPQEIIRRRHPYGDRTRNSWGATCSIPLPAQPQDPVRADLAAIPALLCGIRNGWIDPGSPNRQSANVLAQLLIAKAANVAHKQTLLRQAGLDPSLAKSRHVDLLVTGVENSLWLGEQFARDLSAVMPLLSVKALSANTVLKGLQNDFESLALAKQSIVLVLSHSGRTFPSLQVMEACDLLVRRGVIRDFFVLVGEPDALLGSPILTPNMPGEPFSRRLFTTGAGRRRAEAASATVAAMHQTLSELLFCLSRKLLQAFPDERQRPLGMRLSRDELMHLENVESQYFLQESREILGVDAQGQRSPTAISRQLERGGRDWAQHVLETPIAWAVHAFYILISVTFGLPLFQTLTQAVVQTMNLTQGWLAGTLLGGALEADIALYVFGPWCWTLALRFWQGRPLLARTGRRSLVVGEAPWIHPLLTNYISKLFSLSFGIASLDVQGGDAGDHLLHTHAHRVVRGTLLFLGIPDGRCSKLQRAEANAVLLTARQSDGIRHWGTGPEIVAIGSEPSIAAGPFRRSLLLPSTIHGGCAEERVPPSSEVVDHLRESRFGAFRRLLASYVFFWAMARDVARLPLLGFKWWRSQSRTRVMTTAAPVSAAGLDLAEPREVAELHLDSFASREQS